MPAQPNAPTIIFKTGLMQGLTNSLVVSGTIGAASYDMVVDTGSNITILRPDVLKRVSKGEDIDVHPVDSLNVVN